MKHIKKRFGHAWPFWIFLPITLLLVAGLVLFRWQTVAGQTPSGSSGADQNFIQGLRQALSSSRLNPSDRQALQKKLEYTERLAAQQARTPGSRGPKGALVPPIPMPTQPPALNAVLGERILPGSEGMVHSWEASINNLWEGSYNGVQYQILAGSSTEDPAQGLLIVFEYRRDQGPPTRQTYPVPSRSGSLSIVERQGSRIRCSKPDGSILFFDLETWKFK